MKRSIRIAIGALVVLLAGTAARAELKLVENFDGMATGSPDGVACTGVMGGTWDTETANTGNVTVEENSGSRVVRFMSQSAGDRRGVGFNGITNPIDEGETGKVFFRFMLRADTQAPRTYMGLISDTSADPVNSAIVNNPTTIPVGFGLLGNASGGYDLVKTDGTTVLRADLARLQWYACWIVADNAADTFDLYLSAAAGPAGEAALPNAEDLVAAGIPFGVETGVPLTGMIFASPSATVQSTRTYIDEIWWDGDEGLSPSNKAKAPSPAYNQADVPRDATLGWTPGPFAAAHDVYLGTAFEDVNAASRTTPRGVLASEGQTGVTFDPPGLLAFGQTYYWRVDEVSASPDSTTLKGTVWSFTTEPYAYVIRPIDATASSVHEAATGPEKTIDRSGINATDQHSTNDTDMWLSSATGESPAWIQYEFDQVVKLHQMWVWNSNQLVEMILGSGVKDVTIEVSVDGTTWTALSGVPVFARATGTTDYAHNTTVDFGGALARYVRLTVQSNWGGLSPQCGLSEVRFFEVPVRAFEPSPVTGATDVALDAPLAWRPGREAVGHEVYFGIDPNALTLLQTVTGHQVSLGLLSAEVDQTYYWRVDEVNAAGTLPSWEGGTWSFTTVPYGVVDDFESYDDECTRVFFSWLGGAPDSGSTDESCPRPAFGGNGTGSEIGNLNPPYAERTAALVHGGRQSMPFGYDNSRSPFYAEASREWASAQSWTVGGVDRLTLHVRGDAPSFLEYTPGTILMNGMGTDIYGTSDEGRFVYKQLSGDGTIVARVDSLANTNAWAKAGVMIRETLEAGSSWAYILASPGNGTHYQARLSPGVGATSDTSLTLPSTQTQAQLPIWVKVERKGNQFSGYYAIGETVTEWTANPWNPQTIVMAQDVYIGLAVTSHAANVVCGAKLSGVSTTGSVSGTWQSVDLGPVQAIGGNSPASLYVVVEDSLGHAKAVTHNDPTVVSTGAWEAWDVPLVELTAGGVNLGSVKKLTIGVGDRLSPRPGGAGKLYIDDIRLTRKGP